jgi:DNA-binding SARP family transcriptional activator
MDDKGFCVCYHSNNKVSLQPASSSAVLDQLLEREKMYQQAIESAEKSGEGSKARRHGRGLKVSKGFKGFWQSS